MQFLLIFVSILGLLPVLVRWTVQGKISVQTAAILAVLLVFLLAIGSRAFRVMAFGLQYADNGTWQSFWGVISTLLPLGVALFGIHIVFGALRANKKGR